MILLTVSLSLLFHHAFCCFSLESLPENKPELCMSLVDYSQQHTFPADNGFREEDLIEFCSYSSVRDASNNGLCEHIQELTPHMSTFLARNLTEFCNTESQISRRQFNGRQVQPNMEMDSEGDLNRRFNLVGGRQTPHYQRGLHDLMPVPCAIL